MAEIDLFPEIRWTDPVPVEDLRRDRSPVPRQQGLYVFTNHTGPLEPGRGVLYVGKTEGDAQGLWSRLRGYVKDPESVPVNSSKDRTKPGSQVRHAGKVNLLTEIQQKYRNGNTSSHVFVRWFVCPAPGDREKALIRHLRPAFNTHFNGDD
ncbi:MAG TPA: hypothetical protein VF457_11915 [Burkholderiaceae bacterium]